MKLQWFGAILVLSASGGFGLHMAASHRKSLQTLVQLRRSLDLMECALQYQLTPLPVLCRQAGENAMGAVRSVCLQLSDQLHRQTHEDPGAAMAQVLQAKQDLSSREHRLFAMLGDSLGRFDLPGQIKGLQAVREECSREIDLMKEHQKERLRSYQTLSICAGAALVILFI